MRTENRVTLRERQRERERERVDPVIAPFSSALRLSCQAVGDSLDRILQLSHLSCCSFSSLPQTLYRGRRRLRTRRWRPAWRLCSALSASRGLSDPSASGALRRSKSGDGKQGILRTERRERDREREMRERFLKEKYANTEREAPLTLLLSITSPERTALFQAATAAVILATR